MQAAVHITQHGDRIGLGKIGLGREEPSRAGQTRVG